MKHQKMCWGVVCCLAVGVFGVAARAGAQDADVRTVRVLTIGNSFAQNACRYLEEIAAADGTCRIVIGTANIGGCTLQKHADLAAKSATDPGEKPYSGGDEKRYSLQEYLAADRWDFVTLQQMSAVSYKPETYHPYIEQLVAVVKEHAPEAEILIHQTWAYRPDSPLLKSDGLTQQQMYEHLASAYDEVANQFDSRILPVGAAFQLARNTAGREVLVRDPDYNYDHPVYPKLPKQTNSLVTGWHWRTNGDKQELRLDFKHGNTKGCFLAGLVWYEVLTGNDATETSYRPKGVTEQDADFLRRVAHQAVVDRTVEKVR
ncbi:DUF4886 domain-containing protein [Stieleria sp. ICT_E10.1]|uniref:DUF4886 domain-containing protein n=1 Tax=Stieleria sedimenti TaxID=2976331 RepID=UPI0021803C04|nr:DUF4886 domain-containing protein [Stieleria sedimenti]MCS7470521.1 DUF4886 domain-containing protein [Stieleria sedimenti]